MAEAAFEVKQIGFREFRRTLDKIERHSKNATNFLRSMVNTRGFADIQDHFRRESGPDGKWKPWSAMYAQMRANKKGPRARADKILQLTGTLRQSLLPRSGKLRNQGRNAVMMVSNVEYSGQHDEGDSTKNIPKREFMYLTSRAQEDILEGVLSLVLQKSF